MFDRSSTFGETLDSPAGRAVLETYLPGVAASPMAVQFRTARLGQLSAIVPTLRDDPETAERFWAALAEVGDGVDARPPYAPAVEADPAYESDDVERGSATVILPGSTPRWGVVEVSFDGPSHGNPYVDVELSARFRKGDRELVVGGFYDGDGTYRVRLLAEEEGEWAFETTSTARSLDGITGVVQVGAPAAGAHGPVGVDGFHFTHADGTRHRPLGTTAYAWTHQPAELQEQTLQTLAAAPFTKMRMCLFPKSYLYNANEPERFPFVGSLADGFDLERFDPEYWANLEQRIDELGALGIEADLILFHAYDRWGFADLGPAVDERYLRYAVRRLAAFANVWWSMANEYDLLWAKVTDDWERLAAVVGEEDPHGHLNSIHNCHGFYDYSKPWITHVSVQRVDVYRTSENTDEWRERWGKPVVIDECAYEGDIDQGWGNITGEEMTRRFWEGAIRGGYVGHGETYLNDAEQLWWSKGGVLEGSSPERIAFLERISAESPTGVLDPLPSDWDVPWGGVAGEYVIGYFGFNRPRFRNVVLPEGRFAVDVLDTWNCTVETLPDVHEGTVRVDLPGRQFMAVRLRRV
ncbi:DUF5605 domain-containing protein [Agromyces atrinae]|uniref:DUF5060 domain-containing protein n=1 Tax=Agromyces atrinae TaxID=592376 RepID=A0A4Q2MCI0_9MICO|nr:DUF5605 domain-containing protein [Agromyces atrinae]NYD67586.1 hypothetical protein [Agromyces atrinae]RXZ88203.1 DUF5060 domain-containing protein [Agromyces atrinae]